MKKINLSGTILILLIFAVDCITGNWLKITGVHAPETIEEYHKQMILFLAAKSFFVMVPYLIVLLFMSNVKLKFDISDLLLLFLCIMSCVVNTYDYFNNGNTRPTFFDWWGFGIAMGVILLIKFFIWMILRKTTSKTPRW
jgi:hypothetical protein